MENLEPLLAFGGNSRAARSARAKLQWRDRYGRFIEMGMGVKFKLRLKGRNAPVSVTGKFVGSTNDPEFGQIYVSGNRDGLPDGFYNVKSGNAAEILATLDPTQLAKSGIKLGQHQDGTLLSDRSDKDIQDADSIPYSPYPEGWTKQANGSIGTDDGSFHVRDAGANGYALYHNNQFTGYYPKDGWDQILSKSNQLDDEEENGGNASGTSDTADTGTDHVAAAKAAVAPYDDDKGTAAKMIDDGKTAPEIIAHLDQNSPTFQQLKNQAVPGRNNIMTAQQRQAQKQLADIRIKADNARVAKQHGNDRQIISKEGVAVPTAANQTSDATKYGVTLHDGSIHQMNRTENGIYNARRALRQAQEDQKSYTKNSGATQAQIDKMEQRVIDAKAEVDDLEEEAGIGKSAQTNTPAPKKQATLPSTPATAGNGTNPNVGLVQNVSNTDDPAPYVLDPSPYKPVSQDDDPQRIAQDFSQVSLQSAMSQAISSGESHVRIRHADGTNATVPVEAIRDAIQHQGSDTNVDTDSDVTINSKAELDALPNGSQVEYSGILYTKNDAGQWTNPKGVVMPNMMYFAQRNNTPIALKKRGDDKDGAPTGNAPKAVPTHKSAKDLQPGDEVGGGTIVSVSRGISTPAGKVDVVYKTPRGVIRNGQWNANTQIPLVNRPKKSAPLATLPDPAQNYYNAQMATPKDSTKPPTPAQLAAANSLLATRQHPSGDAAFDAAFDDVTNSDDPSATSVQTVINSLRAAPKADAVQLVRNNPGLALGPLPDNKKRTDTSPAQPNATPATPAPTTPAGTPISGLEDEDEDIYDPNLVMEAIQRKYPNGKELANGDYLIDSRTVTGAKGAQKRYDTVVTRTSNEYFYVYMRETDLTTGKAKSQRVGPMVHSAKALNNRVAAANKILNASRTPDKWFNSKKRRPSIKDDELNPATGEFEHVKEQPILDSTVHAIFAATNDDQITEDVIRDVFDTIARFGTSDATLSVIRAQHNLNRTQLNDLVDTINSKVSEQDALSKFQTWVSADGVTPLAEGDIIRHVSGRVGTIKMRIVDHNTKGYEYTDYVFVQFHDANGNPVGKYTNLTSRKMTLIQTADGTDGSERVGPNAKQLPQPTLSTRAQNRKNAIQAAMRAHRQRAQAPATPPQQVQVTRTPTGNTITLPNGSTASMDLTRDHVITNDTITSKTPDQLVPGDKVQILDPNTGKPRLAQVVDVKTDGDDNSTVLSAIPSDTDSNIATLVNTYVPGSNGPSIQALYDKFINNDDDDTTPASSSDIDRLNDSWRDVDITQIDQNLANEVSTILVRHIFTPGAGKTKAEIDSYIEQLSKGPRNNTAQNNTGAANLTATLNVAQSVADDTNDVGLQNSINKAKIDSDHVNTPQGRVAAIIAENSNVEDLSDFSFTSRGSGSNPGGFYTDSNGQKIYLKEQDDQAHADNEVLASALYRATGLDAITALHGTHPNINKPVTYSRIIDLDRNKDLNSEMRDPAFAAKVHKAFAVDAWLANWDSTLNGNIAVDKNGNPVHVDVGGAIQFRAQGQPRTNFGDKVDELDTLVNPRYNSAAAAVYGSMSDADKTDSARQLLNISNDDIDTLVKEITGKSLDSAAQDRLATTLKNRRKFILDKYSIADDAQAAPGAPNAQAAPSSAPAPALVPTVHPIKPNIPTLQVQTAQDAQGVHYPVKPLTQQERSDLRHGLIQPSVLPFKLANTDSGEVHYYDETGTRRWGQYGAAGAMMRRQRPDGTFEYFLAQRASTLSTGANQWSVPSGAHDTLADSKVPGLTAQRELAEELGIDPAKVTYAGDYISQPAPDWAFGYSFFDVAPGEYDTAPNVDPSEIQATKWATQDEMDQMLKNGELHESITDAIHQGIHNTSASLPTTKPNTASQNVTAPPAPSSKAPGQIEDRMSVNDTDELDNAPAGQAVSYSVGGYHATYQKQPDGKWALTDTDDPDYTKFIGVDLDFKDAIANAVQDPNRPVISQGMTTPATIKPVSADLFDDVTINKSSTLDSAAPGQKITYTAPNGTFQEFEKQADGTWVGTYNSDPAMANMFLGTNVTDSLKRSVDNPNNTDKFKGGAAPRPAAPAAPTTPTTPAISSTIIPDGQTLTGPDDIDSMAVGQRVSLVKNGDTIVYEKQRNGQWLAVDSTVNGYTLRSGDKTDNLKAGLGRTPGNYTTGDAITPNTGVAGQPVGVPHVPVPDGTQVDDDWVDSAPVGQPAHFTNPITGQPVQLTHLGNGQWTNGQRIFSSQSINNLNKGRSNVLAGSLPKPPEQPAADPEDGQLASADWVDNAPTGAVVHFTSSTGDTYNITKRDNGEWDVEDPKSGYPAQRKGSSIKSMAANGKITIGKQPPPPPPAPPAPPTDAQVGLDNLLSSADPSSRLTSALRLRGKSDDELDAIYDDIHAKTRSRRALTDQEIDALIEKYKPTTPETWADYFDMVDDIQAQIERLQQDAGVDAQGHALSGRPNYDRQHANYLLAALTELRGFNGEAQIVSDANQLPGTKIYRGMGNLNRTFTGKHMADQFRTANIQYAGAGMYGDGNYFATNEDTAKGYAQGGSGGGYVMTASIDPTDMNLLTVDAYGHSSAFDRQKAKFDSELEAYLKSHGYQRGSREYNAAKAKIENVFNHKSSYWGGKGTFDMGVFAVMQGYDAIQVKFGGGDYYYVILNRGKTTVLDKDYHV